MNAKKKIEEGLEHVKNAEKSIKTSFLKWNSDYETAAEEYNKAATCFRNAKSYEQCKDCLLKAVECFKQTKSLFYAARALDQTILMCKELGQFGEIPRFAERSSKLYQTEGNNEMAASVLDRAAKILETTDPRNALQLYQHAIEVVLIQDNTIQAAEYASKVSRLHVKLQEYDLAVDAIQREMLLHQKNESCLMGGRLAIAMVLVHLARGDVVAAVKSFEEWEFLGASAQLPELEQVQELLNAYDEEDPETAKRILNCPFIKHMDVEYTILARDLPLPESSITNSRKKSSANESKSAQGDQDTTKNTGEGAEDTVDTEKDDEEYEGGLC